ncbi:betaine/carnitine transporter, BCCT family [Dethiosulfatibacter aminovorans DSM 17477]|uniref:Betaine/carnitine transporter, BCCT family n=1 Tax=Dethiosulfatibacter aminovorans DSM 17477 TaxID=1121476 RepID=A0A1M6M4N8_9FIRM|nr:BCCT family transporter [Dethiosulfatibacter aminovorans]SHJ78444.1 betaine/carnitine transporter, BCCT family [Dethiosulfatibacter aminovorans DSM 17477]
MNKSKGTSVDRFIFWGTLVMLIGIIVPIVLFPEESQTIVAKLQAGALDGFGWGFLVFTFGAFIFCIFAATSKWGKVKLGEPDDKPEYSTFSWCAMLFCAGQGSSIIYWGVIEWVYYYIGPPPGIEPMSVEAANVSTALSFFHWGPSAWAVYCLPALPMAYLYWKRREPVLRLSQTCQGVIPKKNLDGMTGKVIDLVILFVIVASYIATLGLGTPMIATGLEVLFGVPQTLLTKLGIIVVWSMIFIQSVYKGLDSGIRKLSEWNVYVAFVLVGLVFVFGPTSFILNKTSDSFAIMLGNYFEWSLFTDVVGQNGFAKWWTVFYFAWWIAIAPFMGLWVARISKGRTIKEIVVAEMIVGTLGGYTVFASLGSSGLHQQIAGVVDAVAILQNQGPTYAVAAILTSLPLGKVLLFLMISTMFLNLATSVDSTAFILAALASNGLKVGEEPVRWYRVFWAVAIVAVPIAMIIVDASLSTLQAFTVLAAIPIVFLMIIMTVSFVKMLKEDEGLSFSEIIEREEKKECLINK